MLKKRLSVEESTEEEVVEETTDDEVPTEEEDAEGDSEEEVEDVSDDEEQETDGETSDVADSDDEMDAALAKRLPARVNLMKVTTLKQDHVRFATLKLQRV